MAFNIGRANLVTKSILSGNTHSQSGGGTLEGIIIKTLLHEKGSSLGVIQIFNNNLK
jgi:hypothetical protein